MTQELEKQRMMMLARRLAAATSARAAKWDVAEGDKYVWESKEGSVTIASRDRDEEPPYELTVCNANRDEVDELTSELLDDDEPAPWNEALVELYRAARRSALRADDVIEALLDALPPAEELGEPEWERSF
jgi:hypothetical protein